MECKPESETPKMSIYEKYYKGKYQSDENFREMMKKAQKKYYDTHKHDKGLLEYHKNYQKNYYATHPEYKEEKKKKALERYYRLKAEKANNTQTV